MHAPVGMGKTLCLAERAAVAIQRGMAPSRILCVTFTNLAAWQMRERVLARCGRSGKGIEIRTFHALCAWILRLEAKALGISTDFSIFDEDDSEALLAGLLRGRRDPIPWNPKEVYALITSAKLASPEAGPRPFTGTSPLFASLSSSLREVAERYQQTLEAYHALDFADLIRLVLEAFSSVPVVRERWQNRFDMVQVDEMQDTHLSEYRVLRTLARKAATIVIAGDFDQTIYEWRGSEPEAVLKQFKADFPGAAEFHFTVNHRTTKTLLETTNLVSGWLSSRPKPRPAEDAPEGEPILYHFARDDRSEAEWIAATLRELHDGTGRWVKGSSGVGASGKGVRWSQIGVLVRPNHRAVTISGILEQRGIPHLTVETYEFFRRQEVKDAVAHLRFLLNPFDGQALRRLIARPPRGIGEATLESVRAAERYGLRMTDLADLGTLETGDRFGAVLEAMHAGDVVVMDTETTGLDPTRDEVVEIAAVRVHRGKTKERFHRYIRPTRLVGASQDVHGYSDAFLAAHGKPPREVLEEFARFVRGAVTVGHNVGFDCRMLLSHARRLGVALELSAVADTFDMARRFVETDDFTLQGLCGKLGVRVRPSHHAMDDVEATLGLLEKLRPLVERDAGERRRVVAGLRGRFEPLAREIAWLRRRAAEVRPAALLGEVLDRSGLNAFYAGEPKRMANLRELQRVFEEQDDAGNDPMAALAALVAFAALAKNVDRIGADDDRVRVLTVHQAKGLEFDAVIVAGLSENEFPNYGAVKEGREAEEQRIFYVALTRARRILILTGHANHNGKWRQPSPYVLRIGCHVRHEGVEFRSKAKKFALEAPEEFYDLEELEEVDGFRDEGPFDW